MQGIYAIIGAVITGLIAGYFVLRAEQAKREAQATSTVLAQEVISGNSTQASLIQTVEAPTSTPVAAQMASFTKTPLPTDTAVPSPTFTPFVPPADGILFQDNFDGGPGPEWVQQSGNWIVADGKLTVTGHVNLDSFYEWIVLKKPEWRNYSLTVDVIFPQSNTRGDVAFAVRNNTSQPLLGAVINTLGDIYFAIIGWNWEETFPMYGRSDLPDGFSFNVQLEVQGNTYILRVNGTEAQRVTMEGYDSGGISLGMDCTMDTYPSCPAYDNVKITYLP